MTYWLFGSRTPAGTLGLILTVWVLLALIDMSRHAELLSHHMIGDRALSPNLSLALFQTGWLLMCVAMMLPSTLPILAQFQQNNTVLWLVGYLMVWLEVGLLVYGSDLAVHTLLEPRVPRATLWLPSLVLLVAGLYQFTPWKRRCLAACSGPLRNSQAGWGALASGWCHGLACAGSCWALMLVMTALGDMSLAWMAALGSLITAEKNLRWEKGLIFPIGVVLLSAASVTALRTVGFT